VPRGDHGTAGTRRLLTFRLDREFRQRLATRLAGEGRTMSEVVILGLQLYVRHNNWFSGSSGASGSSGSSGEAGVSGPGAAGTTAVASVADLELPDQVASYLRELRKTGQSDRLSATLARLHEVGWPLRPLADALGISRQAVQARVRQTIPDEIRQAVPAVPPPSAFPRRRPAAASGRRPHLTVKVDQTLRSDAHRRAEGEGSSLSQVIEKILDHYLRHGLPPVPGGGSGSGSGEILLGDTTPTRPRSRRKRRTRGEQGS
jgi:antitoxin component of RelBE/YafQ-DinJ toxin-antitoxin module